MKHPGGPASLCGEKKGKKEERMKNEERRTKNEDDVVVKSSGSEEGPTNCLVESQASEGGEKKEK